MAALTYFEILVVLDFSLVMYLLGIEYKTIVFSVMGTLASILEIANLLVGGINLTVELGFDPSSLAFIPFSVNATTALILLSLTSIAGSFITATMSSRKTKEE